MTTDQVLDCAAVAGPLLRATGFRGGMQAEQVKPNAHGKSRRERCTVISHLARKMPARAPSKDLSRPWIRVTVLVHASVVRRPIRSAIFGQVHSILITNMSKSYQITGHYFSGSHWRKNAHILVFRRYRHTATVIICRCSNNIFQQAQVLGKQCPWISPESPPEYRLYRRRYISFEWSSQILHSPRNGRIWLFVWWGTFLLVFLTELKNM